jgi:hypothetical protein
MNQRNFNGCLFSFLSRVSINAPHEERAPSRRIVDGDDFDVISLR